MSASAAEGHVAAARDGNLDPAGTAAADSLQCMSIASDETDGTLPEESTAGAAADGAAVPAEVPDEGEETRSAERSGAAVRSCGLRTLSDSVQSTRCSSDR
jgi:hypothetical protein